MELPGISPPPSGTAAGKGFRSAAAESTGLTVVSRRETNAAGFACTRAGARSQGRSTAAPSRQDERARQCGAPRRRHLLHFRRAPPLGSRKKKGAARQRKEARGRQAEQGSPPSLSLPAGWDPLVSGGRLRVVFISFCWFWLKFCKYLINCRKILKMQTKFCWVS